MFFLCVFGNFRKIKNYCAKIQTLSNIIYRYCARRKKMRFFCRFFAQSVLFFIKLFYLCTDFRVVPVREAYFRAAKRRKLSSLKKNEKKLRENFVVSKIILKIAILIQNLYQKDFLLKKNFITTQKTLVTCQQNLYKKN